MYVNMWMTKITKNSLLLIWCIFALRWPFSKMAAIEQYGYEPVIRLKMAISGRHAHIHADKTDISR